MSKQIVELAPVIDTIISRFAESGLTTVEFAQLAGVTQSTVSRILNRKTQSARRSTLDQINGALDAAIADVANSDAFQIATEFPVGRAIKANPGGVIAPDQVFGRDALITAIWDTLEQQSVTITAERRIGKTSLLRKMQCDPRDGWIVCSRDLEGTHSAREFADTVFRDVQRLNSDTSLATSVDRSNSTSWKERLQRGIEIAISRNDERVLFLWDEFPFMIQHIASRDGNDSAMEVLDALRAIRQRYPSCRMILTGSIGLHHVVSGHRAPLNDMFQFEVPPLEPHDAEELAETLLRGEGFQTDDADVAAAIAGAADNVPYLIHHIVHQLKVNSSIATCECVDRIVDAALTGSDDPWHLQHYEDRLSTYYPGHEGEIVAILDTIACAACSLRTDQIHELLATTEANELSRDMLLKHLNNLLRDHYLQRTKVGFSWKFALIAKWWRISRDLGDA